MAGSGGESVTLKGGGSHQKKRVGGGMEKQLKYKQTNKNLPLPSAFHKCNKWDSDQSHHHQHVAFLQIGSSWVIKVAWVACRKPQCKSSDNGRQVLTDPAHGPFQKEFNCPVIVPCSALSVHAGHTHPLVTSVGVRLSSEIYMQDDTWSHTLEAPKTRVYHTALRSLSLGVYEKTLSTE